MRRKLGLLVVFALVACSSGSPSSPGGGPNSPTPSAAADDKADGGAVKPHDPKVEGGTHSRAGDSGTTAEDVARGGFEAGTIDPGPCAPVSFSGVIQPILTASCDGADCHINNAHHPSALNLAVGKAYAQLVNMGTPACSDQQRVVPGDPSSSYILHKLTGHNLCDGEQMPKGKAPLDAASIKSISDWICTGAPNN